MARCKHHPGVELQTEYSGRGGNLAVAFCPECRKGKKGKGGDAALPFSTPKKQTPASKPKTDEQPKRRGLFF